MKSAYELVADVQGLDIFCKKIWEPFIPPSRSLIIWLLFYNRIPTHDNLKKRGKVIISACMLCDQPSLSEEALYFFFKYPFALKLWTWWYNSIELSLDPFPNNIRDCINHFINTKLSPQLMDTWKAGFAQIIWIIWYSRNDLCLNNRSVNLYKIFNNIHC